VLLANIFALARSNSMLRAFGFRADWRSLFLAFAAGNIATHVLNVIGQSLSRAMVLERAGIPFSVSVLATYIERILAAGVLLVFSLAGVWILFSGITIELDNGIGDSSPAAVSSSHFPSLEL
jgi:hypothetical protein